jgi:ketosteroid isomerase-like protein
MAAKNINAIKQIYRGFERRDFGLIGRYFDPEVELYQTEFLPWSGHYRGHEGAARFFAKIVASIDSTVEIGRFIDAGDGHYVVEVSRTRGTAKQSGKGFDVVEVHVWRLRDEKVVSFQSFIETPAIRAALGSYSVFQSYWTGKTRLEHDPAGWKQCASTH